MQTIDRNLVEAPPGANHVFTFSTSCLPGGYSFLPTPSPPGPRYVFTFSTLRLPGGFSSLRWAHDLPLLGPVRFYVFHVAPAWWLLLPPLGPIRFYVFYAASAWRFLLPFLLPLPGPVRFYVSTLQRNPQRTLQRTFLRCNVKRNVITLQRKNVMGASVAILQIFRGAVRTLILKLHFLPTTQLVCSDHVHTHSRKQDSTRNVHQLCIHRLTRDHAQTHNIDTKTRRQETTQDRY